MDNDKKLKVVVVREELVKVAGGFFEGLILGQLIYWTERMHDVDAYIAEEINKNKTDEQKIPLTHGWVYKSAKELTEELMLDISEPTIRKYIKKLIDMKFLEERRNPNNSWDKVLQYRVNISRVREELEKMGYVLSGYPKLNSLGSEQTNLSPKQKILASEQRNLTAIPEITTENITETTNIDDDGVNTPENPPLLEILQKNRKRLQEISEKRKQKNYNKKVKSISQFKFGDFSSWFAVVRGAYEAGWKKLYPNVECVQWGAKEIGQVKSLMERLGGVQKTVNLIGYVFDRWNELKEKWRVEGAPTIGLILTKGIGLIVDVDKWAKEKDEIRQWIAKNNKE